MRRTIRRKAIARCLLRRPLALLRPQVEAARKVPKLEQTAWQRATTDTSDWANRVPVMFGAITTAGAAALGIFASSLSKHIVPEILLGVVGAVVGFYAVVSLLAGVLWVAAPVRQRDEARAQLPHPETLAEEFSAWVAKKRAALPAAPSQAEGLRFAVRMFDLSRKDRARANMDRQSRHEDERRSIEALHAQARTEYHERFRGRVVAVLGDRAQTQEPQTVADLERLSVLVSRATGTPPPPKAVLRALYRDGLSLRDEIPLEPTTEQREGLEPRVDAFRQHAGEELSECAPECVSELEQVPSYHPVAFDQIPLKGDLVSLREHVQRLLAVISRAIKGA